MSLGMEQELKYNAKLDNDYSKKKNFTRFLKGITWVSNKGLVKLKVLKGQESYKIKSFVESNCWAIFKSGKEKFKKGDIIECLPLNPSI